MTSDVRFEVEEVFDLEGRGGLLVTGRLVEGHVGGGTTLRNESSGTDVHVTGVEFPTPRQRDEGRTTLIVDRASADTLTTGSVLLAG